MKKNNKLKNINLLSPPKVIFLGNGINRITFDNQTSISLKQLIAIVSTDIMQKNKSAWENVPFPLKVQFIKNNSKENF